MTDHGGSTSDFEPESVVDALAAAVAGAMPVLAARIPAGPAATLGRLGVPPEQRTDRHRQVGPLVTRQAPGRPVAGRAVAVTASGVHRRPVRAVAAGRPGGSGERPEPAESPVLAGVRSLGPLLAERLLGALEIAVERLPMDVPAGLVRAAAGTTGAAAAATGAAARPRAVAMVTRVGDSAAVDAVALLDGLRPGASALVGTLVATMARHPAVAPLLAVDASGEDEAGVAARHGTAYLAMATATAVAVLRELDAPRVGAGAPAVVGTALGALADLLPTVPMPAAYPDALLAQRRAEYLLPRAHSGAVEAGDHLIALVEGEFPTRADFSGNGLVAVVDGGVAIRTGVEAGPVRVLLRVLAEPPTTVDTLPWDEVVEVSWTAATGAATLTGPDEAALRPARVYTPPWPGEYRVRVHASGRDEPGEERYELHVWSAPAAEEVVHKRADRLGHLLRGEPVPPAVVAPEAAYRWVGRSALGDAATVTVVAGRSAEDVLRGFGADPAAPASLAELLREVTVDPWVAVLSDGGHVLAVEFNGYQGAGRPVLDAVSRGGRAASMFWNVNALTRLSFARDGTVLGSFEPGLEAPPDDPDAVAALDGLDLEDYRDRTGKGLVAVERFTGRGLREEDLARIAQADVAYRILPLLPALYAEERRPDGSRRWPGRGPLGADTDLLARLPDARLREFAWWAAGEAVAHAGMAGHPAVAATMAARALTPEAELLARESQRTGRGEHHWMWMALHRATNPDPLGAAIGTLDAARYAAGGQAADLLDRARRQLTCN
ncbi:MAG: DUF6461 domain-containing protein [Mycobacteriales bacterium]